MYFVDRVATEVPKSNQPLQKIWEKAQGKFLREMYSDDNDTNELVSFEDYAASRICTNGNNLKLFFIDFRGKN